MAVSETTDASSSGDAAAMCTVSPLQMLYPEA